MKRQTALNLALISGLFIAGGLCGLGARTLIGGLKKQHAQLEQCARASKQSHATEEAGSKLAHLVAEVPPCMNGAGYEKALNNKNCSVAIWQGDVFCYVPKSYLGKLIYRLETSSDRMKIENGDKPELHIEQAPQRTLKSNTG
jgi:hypothetical protein